MQDINELTQGITEFVKDIFEKNEENFCYHNWTHTSRVITAAHKIGESENLSVEQKENLKIAALFHDVAYFKGGQDHEINSAEMAREFLSKEGFDDRRILEIERIILATKMGLEPNDLLEEIIQDADLAHLGDVEYFSTTFTTLKDEINKQYGKQINKIEWIQMSIEFMSKHQFNTAYAREHYSAQKQKNIELLKDMLNQYREENPEAVLTKSEEKKKKKKDKKDKKNKKEKPDLPEKGVETMFRVTLRNHVNLSKIADNKANTLISVNGIIISIVLSTMFPKMDTNPYIIYPGLSLIIFSILTIILSILSTIPKTSHGMLSRDEVMEKKGNLIFFGNFHRMSLDDYEWSMSELMKDKDYLYKSLTRDLYFLGKVLNRKYQLLRYSYYTFVTGLLVSIFLFIVSLQDVV